MSRRTHRSLPALVLLTLAACHGGSGAENAKPAPPETPSGTPVQVAAVELASLAKTVSAPGRTVALVQRKIRAPFAGTLTELSVVVGDTVQRGEKVGAVVARDSEAAVTGAEEMLRDAKTAAARTDAERALALARQNRVVSPLRSWAAGVVIDRVAAAGDRVAEDQELVTVADVSSLVFAVDLAQSDLVQVRPGQGVEVALAGRGEPLRGVVHGFLANADPANSTAPIRVDLTSPPAALVAGLFGTARITVARHARVPVVPRSAVLTDDVSGVRRLAEVIGGKAHWIEVQTGLSDEGRVEINRPSLTAGTQVIVSGQVGLPEGALVAVQP
jgi:multidrug efflux pump subunit AcrA (membrane-fusion protein)